MGYFTTKCSYILFSVVGHKILDVPNDIIGGCGRVVSHHRHARSVNKNLLEVPSNITILQRSIEQLLLINKLLPGWWAVFFEEIVEGMFIFTVHVYLLEKLEVGQEPLARPHVLDTIENLFAVTTWLLLAKLVAWKS